MNETTWDYVVQDFSPLLTYFGAGRNSTAQRANLDPAWKQNCPYAPSALLGTLTICDLGSTHTTNVRGAGVALTFYGQGVRLAGNVTDGMKYLVRLDDKSSSGAPVNQTLASFRNLAPGVHTVSMIAYPPPGNTRATLLFKGVTVTIGTGLTGANVTRTIVQDNDSSLTYTPGVWQTESFDFWQLPHATPNGTWHQINASRSGGVSLNVNEKEVNAVIAHGASWSFFPSAYRVTRNRGIARARTGNSSIPDSDPSRSFLHGVIAVEPNPFKTLRRITIDNSNGEGYLGIDYFEVITVSGGTPLINNRTQPSDVPGNAVPTPTATPFSPASRASRAALIVGPIVGGFVLLTILGIGLYWFICRRRSLREPEFETLHPPSRTFDPNLMVRRRTFPRSLILS